MSKIYIDSQITDLTNKKLRIINSYRLTQIDKYIAERKDKVVNDLLKRISNLEFDVEDKQREIESLKQINEEHKKINGELRVENDRLNNAVNELEKWVEEKFKIENTQYYYVIDANDLKRKIKELKG